MIFLLSPEKTTGNSSRLMQG